MIKLTRVYEPANSADGARYLVERLWPRGMKKTALRIDAWLKDVAPSTTLRRWFNHDPKKWRNSSGATAENSMRTRMRCARSSMRRSGAMSRLFIVRTTPSTTTLLS